MIPFVDIQFCARTFAITIADHRRSRESAHFFATFQAMSKLTHFDANGQAHMVDVVDKAETRRVAIARGRVVMRPETLALIVAGEAKKGDVIGVARVAAIQAAKRT